MSKGNSTAQELTSNISGESILITVESNWIQTKTVIWFVWFVLFIWLTETNRINQMNQRDQRNQINQTNKTNQIHRTGLIPPTEVPSLGSMEPSCRLRVMPVIPMMVSQPAGAKTDQRDETSA